MPLNISASIGHGNRVLNWNAVGDLIKCYSKVNGRVVVGGSNESRPPCDHPGCNYCVWLLWHFGFILSFVTCVAGDLGLFHLGKQQANDSPAIFKANCRSLRVEVHPVNLPLECPLLGRIRFKPLILINAVDDECAEDHLSAEDPSKDIDDLVLCGFFKRGRHRLIVR